MPRSEQESPRVVITGIGLVSALGLSAEALVERCRVAESAIGPLSRFDAREHASRAAAQVPDFDLAGLLRYPKNLKFMNLSVQFAMLAAIEAIRTSKILMDQVDTERVAVYAGSGQTGLKYSEFFRALSFAWEGGRDLDYKYLGGRAAKLIDPYFSLRTLSNAGLALLSAEIGARGPSSNFVQTDTASAMALQAGCYDLIEGRCDVAVAGGYDALLQSSTFLAFERAGLLSSGEPGDAFRPFDLSRDGMVLGEGACFFVLEREEDALLRGADLLAEICGLGSSMDYGERPGLPSEVSTYRKAIEEALGDLPEPDFIVARGIGTREDDRREAETLDSILGNQVPVTAFKSLTGYLGAATAAVELGLGLLCAREKFVPPIARLSSPDPGFRLNLVAERPFELSGQDPLGLFLSSSWGGQVSTIAARTLNDKPKGPRKPQSQ